MVGYPSLFEVSRINRRKNAGAILLSQCKLANPPTASSFHEHFTIAKNDDDPNFVAFDGGLDSLLSRVTIGRRRVTSQTRSLEHCGLATVIPCGSFSDIE